MRLDSTAKVVSYRLRIANPTALRIAARIACDLAFLAAPLNNSVVMQALNDLQNNDDQPEEIQNNLRRIAAQLDEEYFDHQEKAEVGLNNEVDYMLIFSQARAVSALAFAVDADPLIAAMESIYEASATVDDPTELYKSILKHL
jgi:hypothetical protein